MNKQISLDRPNATHARAHRRTPRGEWGRQRAPLGRAVLILALAFGLQLATDVAAVIAVGIPGTAASATTRMGATYRPPLTSPALGVSSSLDMRDDGYNSELVFGMTKGLANSTIIPAIKPFFFLITLPLDLAFLPVTLIAGFF